MELNIEAVRCPNCGAPLKINSGEEFAFCLYCNSSIRVTRHEDSEEHQLTHTEIPPETIDEIKKLLLSGKKEEAVILYSNFSGISKEDSEKAVSSILERITNTIILSRPLSTKGIFICILFLFVAIASFYSLAFGLITSTGVKVIFWGLLFLSLLNFASLWRSIAATIKYFPIKWTKATIMKFILINQKKKLSFFKVLLDIKGYGGSNFQAESKIMIKTENVSKLQVGKVLDVKYLEDEKENVVASVKNL